jgi:hypothetical protein
MKKRPMKGSVVVDFESGQEFLITRMPCSDKMIWNSEETYFEIKEMRGSVTFAVSYTDMLEDFEVKL